MKEVAYFVGASVFILGALHFGYKAVTGECPCALRRKLQLRLAMYLIRELEWEGFLMLEEEEV